ncbi:hypothetical protein EXS70_03415 [Candidatus Peribacteria bacterium]|nr:hypothetical protein [Candidatus Peribacteria bacterium]
MAQLSLTGKQWILRESDGAGGSVVEALLKRRHIDALGEGELLETFGHDARHFRDFEKAAERVRRAIDGKETVGIFGDYDCDGITGATLLARFFHRRNMRPSIRLPHRLKEGYGLQKSIVEDFQKTGITLLLTVDTGGSAVEPIALAQSLGIDVIVLDHHTILETLPPAFAILHPAFTTVALDSPPCGAGVAWSFVSALEQLDGHDDWDDRGTDVALGAIGTIADIVPLIGGNRTLAHSGLLALSGLRTGPLAMLCTNAGLQGPYNSRDVGFRIAPRINAAGRMDDPHIALHALLGDMDSLLQLDALNRERQDVVAAHIEDLLPRAGREEGDMLCFVSAEYSPGICGLLAGKLCEAYGKPALVGAQVGEVSTASLRSIPGYDITAGLRRCGDLLLGFGGHAMAAGCSFKTEMFPLVRARLQSDALTYTANIPRSPALGADGTLSIAQVTATLCESLAVLEPFGEGNPEPRFIVENVHLEKIRRVGKIPRHLQATAAGRKVIGFNLAHLADELSQPIDLLCKIGIDTWQGRRSPQLFLEDVRIAERIQMPGSKNQVSSGSKQKTSSF